MIATVQTQIADLLAQQITIDYDVYFSNVSATLSEVIFPEVREEEPPATFSERLGKRVSSSVAAFVAFCQGLLLAVIAIAPVLVVLLILGAIALPVVRVIRKRGKKRISAKSADPDDKSTGDKGE